MKDWLKAPAFSPRGFVVRAVAIALLYGVLSLAGFRNSLSVLVMTYPEGSSRAWADFACMAYLVAHFLGVLGVPILLLAALLMVAAGRLGWLGRKDPPAG